MIGILILYYGFYQKFKIYIRSHILLAVFFQQNALIHFTGMEW